MWCFTYNVDSIYSYSLYTDKTLPCRKYPSTFELSSLIPDSETDITRFHFRCTAETECLLFTRRITGKFRQFAKYPEYWKRNATLNQLVQKKETSNVVEDSSSINPQISQFMVPDLRSTQEHSKFFEVLKHRAQLY